ncbi:MAG: hypothetical protein QNK04_02475 [Myxococcota bacterium]|nr:hypothetical protein [Myxococcota bacterium]
MLRQQFGTDIGIFEHKRHLAEPLPFICDGLIPVFRRWTKPLYR